MNRKLLIGIPLLISLLVLVFGYVTPNISDQSDNWRVTVIGAENYKRDPMLPPLRDLGLPSAGRYVLELSLYVTYIRPTKELNFPTVAVLDQRGQRWTAKVLVAPTGSGGKRLIKNLEVFNTILYFDIPNEFTNLKLLFDDVPPISFTVR